MSFYTDSATECVDGLQQISDLLDTVLERSNNWKWVIITLHNTVQNFMVTTLRDSAGVNILKKNIQAQFYKSLRDDSVKRPKELLADFMYLYKMTKKPEEMNKYIMSKHFIPTNRQNESIRKLHIIRNEFMHYVPKGYVVYISGMPDIIKDCLDYFHFLTFESGHLAFHRDEDEEQIKILSGEIRTKCDNIYNIFMELNEERRIKVEKNEVSN